MQSMTVLVFDALASYGPLCLAILVLDGLVEDPVSVLLYTLPAVLAMTGTPLMLGHKGSLASLIYSMSILTIVFIPATYCLVVLMGAPFTTHVLQTILFSSHLATMTFLRAIARFGLTRSNWLPLVPTIEEQEVEADASEVKRSIGGTGCEGIVWGTLLGAYLGAVPIPLDWDRAWQKWPVTVHLGACAGLAVGSTLQAVFQIFHQSRITHEPEAITKKRKLKKSN